MVAERIRSEQYFSLAPESESEMAPVFPVLADVQAGSICWESFTAFKRTMPIDEFRDFLASYLVDMQLHLEQMARSRARQDFVSVAWEARFIAIQASAFGALRVRAAAVRLERACNSDTLGVTYRLLGELSQNCEEASKQLQGWLRSPTGHP
jgi:HPt (histidine-containing phosphotransfer) domain-containing protein